MKKTLMGLAVVILLLFGWFTYLSNSVDERGDRAAQKPVITVMDILHASDLQAGVLNAVANNNAGQIDTWMDDALAVAEAAQLAKADIDYLTSAQARHYVVFNAKRQLFNKAFEARYYALEDMGDLKSRYPEAQDLFARAEQLLYKRDAIIVQMAMALSGSDTPDKNDIANAKKQWLQQAQSATD